MERAKIIETINGFLVDEFEVDPDDIILEENLHETLDLDSLDYVDLVVVIQSHFGFKLTAEDFKGVDTFKDFYAMIEEHLRKFTEENA
ncbi:acyl carrier protein [Aureispira anguillae]|uniref:Acyl carrier protein n=1 Tax=Aureispira anguillae TaxID=2864201 RepID=A0A915YMD0_9BACT|nr:acyl carrier protein [Aureispira anguillae]BDS15631.1 acyl carrier protein [Aureispira anguillae]